jgi:hypothetical protein
MCEWEQEKRFFENESEHDFGRQVQMSFAGTQYISYPKKNNIERKKIK